MGLSIVRYVAGKDDPCWGYLRDGRVYELKVNPASHTELIALHRADSNALRDAVGFEVAALDDLTLRSPVTGSIQLFCQGLNYSDHRAEGGMDKGSPDEENLIFTKAPSSICGPNDDIVRPIGCELLDYEIELGIVLGVDIHGSTAVPEDRLCDWVGAFILANDVSARDISFGSPAMQWFRGKSQRTFCPLGPVLYLMDSEDFEALYALELQLRVNGEIKQKSSTAMLIHKPAKTLSDISQFADLNAGDCVLTGTPGGVQLQMTPKTGLAIIMNMRNDEKRRRKLTAAQLQTNPYLQPGDQLELSIRSTDGSIDLGTQRNRIVAA
ncbi:MAG: fumarylacetoacetate hydrolase family protein [Pseudomonadota bacterium]